jgi:hypothetical protein
MQVLFRLKNWFYCDNRRTKTGVRRPDEINDLELGIGNLELVKSLRI